jgi:hypothetical protein
VVDVLAHVWKLPALSSVLLPSASFVIVAAPLMV